MKPKFDVAGAILWPVLIVIAVVVTSLVWLACAAVETFTGRKPT